ncbi:piRNA biogenesis protein exd1 [Bulinus truncatus]|nr:piRNA biogenesis protein exd1 [Bulinus truncatus]
MLIYEIKFSNMAGSLQSDKVILTTRSNAKFEGILHSLDQGTGRIILKNVITEGVKIARSLHFYTADLIDFQYVIETQEDSKKITTLSKQSLLFFKNSFSRHMPPSDSDQLSLSHIFNEKNEGKEGKCQKGLESVKNDVIEIEKYRLIDEMSDEFYEVVQIIKSQSVIGIHFDGHQIGRHGTLTLIEVATQTMVFVFDILALKTEAFTTGLQDVFESESIVKVIHDSRFVSDMLRHQFDITLKNVFDTQVACAFVFRARNRGDWPRHVVSLHSCLKKYLDLSDEQVFFKRVRENAIQTDENVFLQRPLSEKMLSAVCTNVYYLIKLRNVLLEKMMLEFHTAVNIYLNYFDVFGGQVNAFNHGMHLLPAAFIDLQRYVDIVCPPHPEDKKTPLLKNIVGQIPEPTEKGKSDNNGHETGDLVEQLNVDGNTDLGAEAGEEPKNETVDSTSNGLEVPGSSVIDDLEISADSGLLDSVNDQSQFNLKISSGSGHECSHEQIAVDILSRNGLEDGHHNAAVDPPVLLSDQNTENSITSPPLVNFESEVKIGMLPLQCLVETSSTYPDTYCSHSTNLAETSVETGTIHTGVLSDRQSKCSNEFELNSEPGGHGECYVEAEVKSEHASSETSFDLDGLTRSDSLEEHLEDFESLYIMNVLNVDSAEEEASLSDMTGLTDETVEPALLEEGRLIDISGLTIPVEHTLLEEVRFVNISGFTEPKEPPLVQEVRLVDITGSTESVEEVDTHEPKANLINQYSGLDTENDRDVYFGMIDDDS